MNDAKLKNYEDLKKQRFEICSKLYSNNLGCPCNDDCIEFTLKPSKKVVITNKMVIQISLPIYGLEYETKITNEISSDELRNLLRFVDESGKEKWEDLAKRCSEAQSKSFF